MNFSRELRRLRAEAGLSQRELAGRVGVSQSCLAKLESGRTKSPPAAAVYRISEVLGVSPEHFRPFLSVA